MNTVNEKFAVVILACCMAYSVGKFVRIDCPGNCQCDIFQDLKRVQCVQKNLISLEADIPRQTDILDLSNNYISTLDEDEFRRVHLDSLLYLNISHNKLSKVHYYAFLGLGKLKILDLSYNAITYVHSQWFVDMSSIRTINLQQNNFFALHHDSVPNSFNSMTLQNLYLSNSNIAYIDQDLFAELPALERLDLSSNYLIQLDVKCITSLSKLKELNIDGNEISCNNELSKYCKNNGVQLYGDACSKKNKGNKFEKIVAAPEVEQVPPYNDINGWLLEDVEVDDLDYISNNNCTTAMVNNSSTLLDFYNLSPILNLACALIAGLVLGIAIGIIGSYSCTQTRHLIEADAVAKRRSQRRTRFHSLRSLQRLSSLGGSSHSSIQYTPHSPIVSFEQCNSETTPITPRKTYDS